jgi:DNA-binding MarR family transcriptional regulator
MGKKTDTTGLVQAVGLLIRKLRATLPLENHGVSWAQKAVLSRLANDGPATTAELARAEAMKPQSMGTIVASLEEKGLVERKRHATDGRQMNIRITSKGLAVRKTIRDAKLSWLEDAIDKLDKDDRETLFAAAGIIKRIAEGDQR